MFNKNNKRTCGLLPVVAVKLKFVSCARIPIAANLFTFYEQAMIFLREHLTIFKDNETSHLDGLARTRHINE